MAPDATPHDRSHTGAKRPAPVRTARRPWIEAGKPINLTRRTRWADDQKFDVLEDEVGVVEIRRHVTDK
jgi:hypothetical protein